MHRAGLRLDDAAIAAEIAVAVMRSRRDSLIRTARAAGMSYRTIARIFSITHPRAVQVVNRGTSRLPPA